MQEFKRLVVFGDSLTYGQGLRNRSRNTWGAHLGNMMGVPVINRGIPVASNDKILRILMSCEDLYVGKDAKVIIMWSFMNRKEVINTKGEFVNFGCWDVDNTEEYEIKRYAERYYRYFHNEPYELYQSFLHINHAQMFLTRLGVSYEMCFVNNQHYEIDENHLLYKHIEWDKIYNNPDCDIEVVRRGYPTTDCGHPTTDAYRHYATGLFNFIKTKVK